VSEKPLTAFQCEVLDCIAEGRSPFGLRRYSRHVTRTLGLLIDRALLRYSATAPAELTPAGDIARQLARKRAP